MSDLEKRIRQEYTRQEGAPSFNEIGKKLGISKELAYQLYETALRKMARFENRHIWWEVMGIIAELDKIRANRNTEFFKA